MNAKNSKPVSKTALWLGIGLIAAIILLVVFIPCPTASQYFVFRIVIALAGAGLASVIPGVLNVALSNGITAGGALAVFAVIFFLDPASSVGEGKCQLQTFSFTVFIHGKEGKEDKILKNQGEVLLYLNSKPERVKIDDDGKAVFTEISPTFLNKNVRITIDHPQPYQSVAPDSLYSLQNDGVAYVAVTLKGMDKVFGEVMDFVSGAYLDSVRVSILDAETYSNSKGWFSLSIPQEIQSKFQRVVFDKPGYQREVYDSVPVHTGKPFSVSLKPSGKK